MASPAFFLAFRTFFSGLEAMIWPSVMTASLAEGYSTPPERFPMPMVTVPGSGGSDRLKSTRAPRSESMLSRCSARRSEVASTTAAYPSDL